MKLTSATPASRMLSLDSFSRASFCLTAERKNKENKMLNVDSLTCLSRYDPTFSRLIQRKHGPQQYVTVSITVSQFVKSRLNATNFHLLHIVQ